MQVQCPDCQAQYSIDPAQIPAGKTGFKCKQCGGFVPVLTGELQNENSQPSEAVPIQGGQTLKKEKKGLSKTFMLTMVTILLLFIGSGVFFYLQLQNIGQGGLGYQTTSLDQTRMQELSEKIRAKQ
ncbi:zinc-ribbon domain-containing protein [Candidatus Venteria ishoeyi]|uniref:DUF7836 family putative zinc-binding protein n=1 Tax=Candidatus Venteria ishoeyi TaxID=1899563 RepID=UPI0025A626E5|nr:zinc-ribbon domain-containing protein [Candidatus Venteria ishoeyi]MDM8547230.1 zinc-ribbon domain-containing protein [Candidatus Venteria ishoeyi]